MSLFDQQGNVIDLTGALDVFAAWIDEALNDDAASPPPVTIETPDLPDATDDLAAVLSIGRAWLQELVDTLQERQQIVLFGPPGTGMTYIARAATQHIADRGRRLRAEGRSTASTRGGCHGRAGPTPCAHHRRDEPRQPAEDFR